MSQTEVENEEIKNDNEIPKKTLDLYGSTDNTNKYFWSKKENEIGFVTLEKPKVVLVDSDRNDAQPIEMAIEKVIPFPFKGNVKDLFGIKNDDDIGFKTNIFFYTKNDSIVHIIYRDNLVRIGNNLVYYDAISSETDGNKTYDSPYYLNFNIKTGDLIVENINEIENAVNKEDNPTIGFFADFTCNSIEEDIQNDIDFKFDSIACVADGENDSELSKLLVLEKTTDDKEFKEYLSTVEAKNDYARSIISWLKELPVFIDKKEFLDFIKTKELIRVDVLSDSAEEIKFDENALIQKFYPNIIHSIIKTYDGNIERDESGTPVLTDEDKKCLTFIGFPKENTEQIVELSKTTIEHSRNQIKDNQLILDDKDFKNTVFDNECKLCLSVNTDDAKSDIEKYIEPLNNKVRYTNEIDKAKKYIDTQYEGIASLQVLARYQVKKQMENGDFNNYHSFTSAMIYFTAMKRLSIVCEAEGKDNYGALNAFMNFAEAKISDIAENDYNFYKNRIMNTLVSSLESSYFSSLRVFMTSVICTLANTGRDYSNSEEFGTLINEVNTKESFIESMSSYPLKTTMKVVEGINELVNFDPAKEEEIKNGYKTFNSELIRLGYKSSVKPEEYSELVDNLHMIRDLINEKYETLLEYFKRLSANLVRSVTDISKKKVKGMKKYVELASNYIAITSLSKYLDTINSKSIKEYDGDKEIERTISDEENKNVILKFILNTVSKELICGVYNRLYESMASVCETIKNNNNRDIGSYYSSVVGSMIVCSEILGKKEDDGVNEKLEDEFDANKLKLIGKDAIKILVSGLTGKESESESRLNVGRNNMVHYCIKLSTIFTKYTLDVIREAISFIEK